MDRKQWKTLIRNGIHSRFDASELRSLVFELGINPDDLRGRTHTERIESLISYMERRHQLPELIDKLRHKRPHENWPDIPTIHLPLIEKIKTEQVQQKSKGFPAQQSVKIGFAIIIAVVLVAVFISIISDILGNNLALAEITKTPEILTQTIVTPILETPSPTYTPISISTPTNTLIPTHTSTHTPTPTHTSTSTYTPTPTSTSTSTSIPPTYTSTSTPILPTHTPTPIPPTHTATSTPTTIVINWASNIIDREGDVQDDVDVLGEPDGKGAVFYHENGEPLGTLGVTYGFGNNQQEYALTEFANLLGVSVELLRNADFISFESNGTFGNPYEACRWIFDDGINQKEVLYDRNESQTVIELGNISHEEYSEFFGLSFSNEEGDLAYILIDVDGQFSSNIFSKNLHITLQADGIRLASPDPYEIGHITFK